MTTLASPSPEKLAQMFDPFRNPYLADPYPFFTQARQAGPVFYSPELDYWMVTRYRDVRAIFQTPKLFSAVNALAPMRGVCPMAQRVLADGGFRPVPTLTNTDPPDHTRARRLAKKLGIDLITLTGTGKGGRIRERDVFAAESSTKAVPPTIGAGEVAGRLEPHTTIRQTIARRMVSGVTDAAPVTLNVKADATNLVALRNFLKVDSPDCPSYNDMIIKLCAVALRQHPMLNAQWREEGIFVPDVVNISVAVDTEVGLMVPVVHDVLSKSLDEISINTRQLIEASQNRQITAGQMEDGTFTVTNLGAFGIEYFTPIINLPQCAILGIGTISQEPVMDGNEVVSKDRLPFSLTFDHRIVDGAPAAKFLQTLCQLITETRQSMLQKLYERALTGTEQ